MVAPLLRAAYAGLTAVLAYIVSLLSRLAPSSKDDVYRALDHRALNLPLSSDAGEDGVPETEWMNMGWWTSVDEGEIVRDKPFPQACEDLARRFYSSAGLQPSASPSNGPVVLDVGHGYGESLLFLSRSYTPSQLDGITYSPLEASRARQRLAEAKTGVPITVMEGDATAVLSRTSTKYDYIFALDCAYHFPSMQAFLQAAQDRLKPGGTLALFDLFMDEAYPSSKPAAWFKTDFRVDPPPQLRSRFSHYINQALIFCLSKSSPPVTLHPFPGYHSLLRRVFGSSAIIEIEDVTSNVFPGFSTYLARFGASQNGDRGMRFGMRLFSKLLARWAKGGDGGLVRCGIVVIKKAARADEGNALENGE
ncbi:S-adenosyl-L-methionine-dependent methyltransferase [Microstroma glucosiphilum]|uniref:S-adenosyl-L-methionine-dependent methyltransferase n=1 Tax=Pseudomicrostroma glucosiphilum TaxID=1684307 RepID=A0A316UDT2_9BASI|nr:S-adenosyl-L-methionine-dependent methyltransferase [Pseudomicrostroma glucosiphilum]PWN22501.1 S-adenosyl-L-methionine-dependent methyltransferase [Pseudomicrostroma glucosiphilum]